MTRRDVLAGEGDRVAALTDGFATIRDADHRWSTVGLYEVIDQRVTACWLPVRRARADRAVIQVNAVMMLARWKSPAKPTSLDACPKPAPARPMFTTIDAAVQAE